MILKTNSITMSATHKFWRVNIGQTHMISNVDICKWLHDEVIFNAHKNNLFNIFKFCAHSPNVAGCFILVAECFY